MKNILKINKNEKTILTSCFYMNRIATKPLSADDYAGLNYYMRFHQDPEQAIGTIEPIPYSKFQIEKNPKDFKKIDPKLKETFDEILEQSEFQYKPFINNKNSKYKNATVLGRVSKKEWLASIPPGMTDFYIYKTDNFCKITIDWNIKDDNGNWQWTPKDVVLDDQIKDILKAQQQSIKEMVPTIMQRIAPKKEMPNFEDIEPGTFIPGLKYDEKTNRILINTNKISVGEYKKLLFDQICKKLYGQSKSLFIRGNDKALEKRMFEEMTAPSSEKPTPEEIQKIISSFIQQPSIKRIEPTLTDMNPKYKYMRYSRIGVIEEEELKAILGEEPNIKYIKTYNNNHNIANSEFLGGQFLAKWNGYNFIPQNEIYFILKYIVGSVYEKQSLYQQNPIDKRTTAVDVKMILGPPFYLKTISDDNRACMDFVELQALYKYIK